MLTSHADCQWSGPLIPRPGTVRITGLAEKFKFIEILAEALFQKKEWQVGPVNVPAAAQTPHMFCRS
jgi:hypothetical protein